MELDELDELGAKVDAHEHRSQERYEVLREKIEAAVTTPSKESVMSENVMDKLAINVGGQDQGAAAATMAAAAMAAGNGRRDDGFGGTLGLLAALGMLGNRNYDRKDGDCLQSQLNTVADGINHNINTSLMGLTNLVTTGFGGQRDLDVMSKLGTIESDIFKAEGDIQLAISTAQNALSNRIADGMTTALAGQGAIRKDISDSVAASLAGQSAIKEAVASYGTANLMATKDAATATQVAIRDDGDKTRALITRQYEDTLNRELSEARNALVELRSAGRLRDSEINITNTNTATATQLQVQAQQQQQLQFMAQLVSEVRNLANDVQIVRQSQSNINFGVQGASTQGQAATNNRVS